MLDNDAIGVREVLNTTIKDRCGSDGDGTATIDDDNVQLALTTTSKQFNARPIPPKYKVRVMSPFQFLRGYIGAAAPQFSLDQFVNKLHMGSVYLEEQPRASIDKEQPQRWSQPPPPRPRSTVRFGGTAAGALRDRSSVAANDARLATKLTQPYEYEIPREAVDTAPTRFAQRLIERMHARAAAKGSRRRKAKRQLSGGNSGDSSSSSNMISATLQTSGAARSGGRTRSTGHGNVATMLQNMSTPTQSNSFPTLAAAAKNLDVTSPRAVTGSDSGIKPAAICALLETSEEDEPAPPRKRRLGGAARQPTISVAHDNTLAPIIAERINSTSAVPAAKTTSTGSMTRYYKIDSFFTASLTRSFDAAAPSPPPPTGKLGTGAPSKHEVISIGSSDDDDYNPADPHDTGLGFGPSGGSSSNDDCKIVVGPSSANADPRGQPLAHSLAAPTSATTVTRVIASPPAVILDDTDDDVVTKTDVDSDIEIIEL